MTPHLIKFQGVHHNHIFMEFQDLVFLACRVMAIACPKKLVSGEKWVQKSCQEVFPNDAKLLSLIQEFL